MYNPFMVKSHTIKGCMGRQKIYRILHCLSLVTGTYTTRGTGVKKSVKSPIPNNSRCEYFWKIWSCSKCQIKTKEKLLIYTLHDGYGTWVGQGMACVGMGLGFSICERHCNKCFKHILIRMLLFAC